MQCNSWCSAIPAAMQIPIQCNSWCSAIPNAMQFLMQFNSWCSTIPHVVQYLMQYNSQLQVSVLVLLAGSRTALHLWFRRYSAKWNIILECRTWYYFGKLRCTQGHRDFAKKLDDIKNDNKCVTMGEGNGHNLKLNASINMKKKNKFSL